MKPYSILVVVVLAAALLPFARGACQKEDDLNFENCNLIDLPDQILIDICNRIGLDMIEHVLPTIVEENNEQTYTHEQYAMGAEECLMVEAEMDRLAKEDPEALDRMEREALDDDPDILAEIISDVLKQDLELLNDVADKIKRSIDKTELVKDITEGMLKKGEKLEDRPDVLGYLVASIMIDDPTFLDEFDAQLAEGFESTDWAESLAELEEEYEKEAEGADGDNIGDEL
jgi:hypothetical protein